MRLKNLREWVNTLPEELDEHDLVYREIVWEKKDLVLKDYPISFASIDKRNKEAFLSTDDSYQSLMRLDVINE